MSLRQPDDTQTELERRALERLSTLQHVRAPDSLHRSIQRMTSDAATHPPREAFEFSRLREAFASWSARQRRVRLAGAGVLTAVAVAIVAILLGSGGQQPPTVIEASRVALAPATLASPAEDPDARGKLESSVEGVAFPYWGGRLHWPAAGARRDLLGGRSIKTVFYTAHSGARVGYAIVAGPPLQVPATGTAIERGGMRFDVLATAGATIVTWREGGHTCILAARGVPATTMMRLVLS